MGWEARQRAAAADAPAPRFPLARPPRRRIEARAPNADHALRVLQRFRTRFLEFMALLAVGECRQHGPDGPGVPAMVGVVMEPLTPPRHDQQIDGGGAAQPPHGEEHWAWALAQARLDPQQVHGCARCTLAARCRALPCMYACMAHVLQASAAHAWHRASACHQAACLRCCVSRPLI